MDDFCEMEFYSSWIKLALRWVLGYFFSVNDEFCGGCGTRGLFTLLSLSLSLHISHSFFEASPAMKWTSFSLSLLDMTKVSVIRPRRMM